MKKIFLISLLAIIIISTFLNINYATTKITEENLEKALNQLSNSEGFSVNGKFSMDKNNKIIKISTKDSNNNDVVYIINYDLSSSPTFSVVSTIDNSTTYDQWAQVQSELMSPMTLYVPIASINGISESSSLFYILQKFIIEFSNSTLSSSYNIVESNGNTTITDKNGNIIPIEDFPNYAIDITKDYYNNGIIFDDSDTANTFKYSATIKEISKTKCVIQAVLTINENGDFSKITTITDNVKNELVNSVQNSVLDFKNTIQDEFNSINKIQEKVNNISSTSSKLPQTGKFFSIKDLLTLISVISFVLLVVFFFKDIKYRNIKQK